MLETIQWIVVMGAASLTALLLLRILFYVRTQNNKIRDFEERLHTVEEVRDHAPEAEEE